MKRENWVYAGARQHGAVERQVQEMVRRIVEHGLDKVTIDIVSEETYQLREVARQLDRWRNAWASQDTSAATPARHAMFKALDKWLAFINKDTK